MDRHFTRAGETLGIMSDGYIEEIWETLIALATAAAICISVISLAVHLNETRAARGTESSMQAHDAADCPRALAGSTLREPRISTENDDQRYGWGVCANLF